MFPFTIPFHLANLAPAASVLVSTGKFSKLRVAPTGIPSPEAFRRWWQDRFSRSFRRDIVYSSQLDDIRRAKLHFAAILHFLHDLIAAIVLVQVNVALRTLVVLLLLQILQNLASVETPTANSNAGRRLLLLLLTDFILANGSPWLFVSESRAKRARFGA